jgi:nucleoside-diphosphate-sugar epimerase
LKRVLITGATGFIGRQCLPMLNQRLFEVHAVVSGSPREEVPGVIWHQANLLDKRQLSDLVEEIAPNHLLHLAWYTRPREYWTSDVNLEWVSASLELFRLFTARGGERAVFAGSCAEYDWRFGYCEENVTPLAPATLYGTCKHSLNLMLSSYASKHDVSTAWGRIFYVYGPHEYKERLVPSVVRSLLRKEPAVCSSGEQVRDFLHVHDVAAAFVTLLTSDVRGNVNIASGKPHSIRNIVSTIAHEIGRPDLVQLGAQSNPGAEAPLVVAHVQRLQNELSFSPRYDLNEGLRQTIQWWSQAEKVTAGI